MKGEPLNELALFAGAGGGILAGKLLGWRTVCAVELDPYAAAVLVARQNDGCLPSFPIWDDVLTFDGRPWRGRVDVISGGFPCQDISIAGKGAGITGERSGLWRSMARIIREVVPGYVFVENSPVLTSRGLGAVLGDLAEMGYNARWGVLGAGHIGGWHLRERIWVLATHPREERIQGRWSPKVPRLSGLPWCQNVRRLEDLRGRPDIPDGLLSGIRHGSSFYVDRVSALGNAQVPVVAATAFRILSE